MKLLYVSGLYMPASGGAELSMRTLLRNLVRHGHTITVITTVNDSGLPFDDQSDEGIQVIRISGVSELSDRMFGVASEQPLIDAVLTQSSWCDRAILFARENHLPVLYFLRCCFGDLDVSVGGKYEPDFVVANSGSVKTYIETRWRRHDVVVIPPLVELADYKALETGGEHITLVNPVVVKGGEIFREIAVRMPERRFLAVRGWGHLKRGGRWDEGKLRDLAAGFGVAPFIPAETEYVGIKNVRVSPTTVDMRSVYMQTRLLLVPSLIPEGGPRVALEAMVNGIPVISSPLGAAGGMVAEGGDVVSAYEDASQWVAVIRRYDQREYYEKQSHAARQFAASHDPLRQLEPLLQILATLAHGA